MIRYERPVEAQGASFRWQFLSSTQKHAAELGAAAGYDAIHTCNIACAAPNTYFVAWSEDDGGALTVVLNLDERTVYTSAVFPTPSRFFMQGVIDSISDTQDMLAP